MQTKIQNPVLTGFNPDPCILRVGKKYYMATSTFEYYPGVQIFESDDLANWTIVARPITQKFQDRTGLPHGGGVWAPCLSHDGEKFYLVYSRITNWFTEPFKDCDNFVITATDLKGEWSDPQYLNSDGFDASHFHDGDKSYYMSVEWDYRKPVGAAQFAGILLWEFDRKTCSVIGKPKKIFRGTDRGLVEAPHIYKIGEYYYLFTAEGGTNVEHAETVARSKNVFGPYEVHPNKHLITSYQTDNPVQKAGHASLVDDGNGNYYIAHLCGRKLYKGNCVLGRETSIQNVVFKEDGWMYLTHGGMQPREYFTVPYEVEVKPKKGGKIPFTEETLMTVYQSLRTPLSGKYRILSPESIQLTGAESIVSLHNQTLLAVRQEDVAFEASVKVDFEPEKHSHWAGLIYRYNEANQFIVYMSRDVEQGKNLLYIYSYQKGVWGLTETGVEVGNSVYLKVQADTEGGQFYYSKDGKNYTAIGSLFDNSVLSDEVASPMGFTGAFVGMYVGDFSLKEKTAVFTDFEYLPR
ncbi:MAG: glycoside hydrolase family 43 protein [Clostridia bacterium]|nr:glycoside hydrolase family 43 protein [Clostridia bacterium]